MNLYEAARPFRDVPYCIAEIHRFNVEGKNYCLSVANSAFFEIQGVTSAIIDLFIKKGTLSLSQLISEINGNWLIDEIEEGWEELKKIRLIQEIAKASESNYRKLGHPSEQSISTLTCVLSKNCNLNCGYCYAEHGRFKGNNGLMEEKLAFKVVDFLIEQSGKNRKIHLTFFGGEPLLNFPVIKSMAIYAKQRANEAQKEVSFSITTNATLLTSEIIQFLNDERIGITISIDGPENIHDRVRKYPDGKGSYKVIRSNLASLFKFYKNGSIAARVTVTRKAVNIKDILFYLLNMGFHEIGFSTVSTLDKRYAFSDDELEIFTRQFQELTKLYVEKAVENKYLGFSNISNLLKYIHEGINKHFPCGGGIGLMGVNNNGEIYVCHRLIGNNEFYLGNLWDGIDRERQNKFLSKANLDIKGECYKCWARYFCGGGCHYEAVLYHGTVEGVHSWYCIWLRQWIEAGIWAYVKILEHNPKFIEMVVDDNPIC